MTNQMQREERRRAGKVEVGLQRRRGNRNEGGREEEAGCRFDETVNEPFLHLLEPIPPLPVTTDKNHSAGCEFT